MSGPEPGPQWHHAAIVYDSKDEGRLPTFYIADDREVAPDRRARSDSRALFFFILGCFAFVAAILLASHCPN